MKMKNAIFLLWLWTLTLLTLTGGIPHTFEEMENTRLHMLKAEPLKQKAVKSLFSVYENSKVRRLFSDPLTVMKLLKDAKVNTGCQQAMSFAISNIGDQWSYTMIDALAKPPSAIQRGAIHWLGGFRQCVTNKPPTSFPGTPPRTHYCRANFWTSAIPLPPQVSIDIGFCIPETCTAADMTQFFDSAATIIRNLTNQPLLYVIPQMSYCYVRKGEQEFSRSAQAMISVSAFIGFILLIGTLYDGFLRLRRGLNSSQTSPMFRESPHGIATPMNSMTSDDGNNNSIQVQSVELQMKGVANVARESKGSDHVQLAIWEKLLLSFSLYSNAMKIMDATQTSNRLSCLDGIRFLSMTWVILGHTYFFIITFSNNAGAFLPELTKRWTYQALLNAYFSVDSFFVLSGFLTAFMFLKEAKKLGSIKSIKFWILYFCHRFYRLTPVYMLFIGFYTALFTYFSEGPMFNQVGGVDRENCEKNWWTNLLYINNVYKDTEMCMGWTWYLANDMQFHFVVAPLILVSMFLLGIWGSLFCIPVLLAGIISTGVISKREGYIGESTNQDGFNTLYIKPWCRVQAYVLGMATALIYMEHKKRKWKLHKAVVFVGWCIAIAGSLGALYGLTDSMNGSYNMSVDATAAYNALSRTSWAVGVCWLIYACLNGYGSIINDFLSWNAFIPLSRLTYCAFLVHPVVQFSFYQSLEYAPVVNTITMVFFFFGHLVASYGVAFILSLAVEAPLIGIEKAVLGKH